MMEIRKFQEALDRLMERAARQEKVLDVQDIREIFGSGDLSAQQMKSLYQYLRLQGIQVKGMEDGSGQEEEGLAAPADGEHVSQTAPLDSREQAWLREYRETLDGVQPGTPGEETSLWQRWNQGDSQTVSRLTELYLFRVTEIAVDLHREGCFIGDMVQEGNMCLWTALALAGMEQGREEWLTGRIRQGILDWLEEQQEQKLGDDSLVEQVRKLEAAIRELSDDTEQKFSVEELSAYLDMDEDEIRSVLSLAGEET